MRTVLVVKEKTILAALAGFFEVFIWYIVVRDALNTDGPVIAIAASYAAGYATGTFVGGNLAKKLFGGHVTVNVVTSKRDEELCNVMRASGYGITVLNVNGSEYGEEKHLILADIEKSRLKDFEKLIKDKDPGSFILVQDTKSFLGGYGYKNPGK